MRVLDSSATGFWATVCKTARPLLSDRCLFVLSCLSLLSVTLAYMWPNGWMDQNKTWHADRPRPWPVATLC